MRGAPKADSPCSVAVSAHAALSESAGALSACSISNANSDESRPCATRTSVSGPDDCENLQDCWKPAIQLDKEPAIMVREPDATMQLAPQNIQLMSKHRVLSFKPQ